jgi:hypothetical protein
MDDASQYRSIRSRGVKTRTFSLLEALHESRRAQAMRAIDNYRHLLGEAKADETRRAIEEFTREHVSIRSLCCAWRSHFSGISLLMKRKAAIACKDPTGLQGKKGSEREDPA